MKSISLITKTKITSENITNKIIDVFPFKKKITINDSGELYLGVLPNEFQIIFDDSMSIEDPNCLFSDEDKQKIPFSSGCVNELFYRNARVAKFIVGIVLQEYPELFIHNDDGEMISAVEFIQGK